MTDERADHIPRPDMTPMIDVVFQLLVFFLVTMKFKTLDMKIEAELPKNVGMGPIGTPPDRVKLVARLTPAPDGTTRVRIQMRDVGSTSDPETYDRFVAAARAVRSRHVSFGGDPDDIDAEIDATPRVPTGHVIRTIDAFIDADLLNVTFVGTPVAAGAPATD